MPRPVRIATVAVLSGLLLTACGSTPQAGSASAAPSGHDAPAADSSSGGAIPVGPGPQARYTVEPQPAPGTCHYRSDNGQPLEDPHCTPGALNPKVTQATLSATVCRAGGYTSTIRPPASVTGPEKTANAKSYNYTGSMRDGEYDHLVSLELGGDPNDPRNLWVEPPSPGHVPGSGPNNPKDTVEAKLHTAVCSGKTTLAAAQQAIVTNWSTALPTLHLS